MASTLLIDSLLGEYRTFSPEIIVNHIVFYGLNGSGITTILVMKAVDIVMKVTLP
jgi:hypothetical protein